MDSCEYKKDPRRRQGQQTTAGGSNRPTRHPGKGRVPTRFFRIVILGNPCDFPGCDEPDCMREFRKAVLGDKGQRMAVQTDARWRNLTHTDARRNISENVLGARKAPFQK